MTSAQELRGHPYFPVDAAIPGYIPNQTPLPAILLQFFLRVLAAIVATVVVSKRLNRRLGSTDLLMLSWFGLNGYIHCVFEAYFVLNTPTLAGSQSLLGQLWKEYALSDSRYLTSDTFVRCIEATSVLIWGPCCLATAFCIVRGSSLRYPLQMITSLAHLYGVALYYSTSYVDMHAKGIAHSRPEFLYFWVYYVGMNLPWAVIPSVILFSTTRKICRVFDAVGSVNPSLLAEGGQEAKKSQ